MQDHHTDSATAVMDADAGTRIGTISFLVAPDPDPDASLGNEAAQDRRAQAMSAWLLAEWQRWCAERDAAVRDSPVLMEAI